MMRMSAGLRRAALVALGLAALSVRGHADPLAAQFAQPPDSARPGVYWYFMDGNQTREGMTADLEAMHRAGLRKALLLEVNIGVPRGPVDFMSEAWQDNFAHAVRLADKLGMEIILGTGPGWCGAGGPWIAPAQSMQHLQSSVVQVKGPGRISTTLPVPGPRRPSPFAGLSRELTEKRQAWHTDVAVLAFPTPAMTAPTGQLDVKALYDTQPYSSWKHVPRYIESLAAYPEPPQNAVINPAKMLDLSPHLRKDGSLDWEIPPGDWTVMRFAARSTGATTRPAPTPGHGFESDRFNPEAFAYHFEQFHRKLINKVGHRQPGRGWTALHLDSWESSAQNWSGAFRAEFRQRRGYDPLPFFPSFSGRVVSSREKTERFLWDLRQTAQELVIQNHAQVIRRLAHENGFYYSSQFYDMNPAGDLDLGAVADVPSCEFWSGTIDTVYSCIEAASIAHTMGRPVVRAEAFTAYPKHGFVDSPTGMKNQTDWALAMGVNDFIIHTYQHQPLGSDGPRPGLAMGPFGVQWHRHQTFWPMVGPFHEYIARCGQMLRQGISVADILYLTPEGAPHIFLPPEDAMQGTGLLREKKGYGFDAVSPRILASRAKVEGGRIAFAEGSSYRLLVLPTWKTMTPELLATIEQLVRDGATVIGAPPGKSPSLSGYPQCDERVNTLARSIWGGSEVPAQVTERRLGKGRIVWGGESTAPASADKMYPSYASTAALLQQWGTPPVFASAGPVRWHLRRTAERDIFFVSNREATAVETKCAFRTDGTAPELWDPLTGTHRPLPQFTMGGGTVEVPLRFAAHGSYFVVFTRGGARQAAASGEMNFAEERILGTLAGPYEVTFDPAWGGPRERMVFQELTAWNLSAEEGIKYYSGEAVYRKKFDRPAGLQKDRRVFIDLGGVHKLARIKINGVDLGIVWTPPFRVEVTDKLRPAGNELEVTVVNTWANRLIGDQQSRNKDVRKLQWESGLLAGKPYPAGRYTFTTAQGDYKADSPLQESGLLGPVQLLSPR